MLEFFSVNQGVCRSFDIQWFLTVIRLLQFINRFKIFVMVEGVNCTLSAGSACPSGSVKVITCRRRKIVVDDNLEKREIESPRA